MKKGMSDVVTTVLILLLAIVAVVVVGGIVMNQIGKTGEKIASASICSELEVEPAKCSNDISTGAYVVVQRGSGGADIKLSNVVALFEKADGTIDTAYIGDVSAFKPLSSAKLFSHSIIDNVKRVGLSVEITDDKGSKSSCNYYKTTKEDCFKGDEIPSLIGYWKFDEVSGNIAADTSANNFDGTLTPKYGVSLPSHKSSGECKVGGCLQFSGTSYVSLPDLRSRTDLFGGGGNKGAITISAWIKPTILNYWKFFVNGFPGLFYLGIDKDDNRKLIAMTECNPVCSGHVNNNYWPTSDVSTSDGQMAVDKWKHIVFVLEGGKGYTFYIDGVLNKQVSETKISLRLMDGNEQTGLGRSYQNIRSEFFRGYMDEVMVFNKALSADEVKRIYDSTK